ncbi:GHKL domain-containing protein [Paraclostridium bifermentans]|uniref:GHKL domain-containing protein n=1 Tax=Paraclostridium bifermentans TaxID=1490 RepID=UPI00359C9CEF
MIINRTIVALITNLSILTIEWLCFKIFIDYFSKQKTSKKTRFLTFTLCVLLSLTPNKILKPIIYIGAGFLFYKINYLETLFKSVIITSVFWISVMVLKTLGVLIFVSNSELGIEAFNAYSYFSSLEIMTFSVLIFIATALLYKYFKAYNNINKKHFISIFFPICVNILSLGIVLVNKSNKVFHNEIINNFSVFFMGILMVFSNIFMIILFRKITRDNRIYIENKIMKEKMDMEYRYYSKIKENQERVRHMYHDMKNHMICIKNLSEDSNKLNEYIKEISSEIRKCETSFNTGNMILDIILNEKKEICESKNIEFNSYVEFKKCDFIKVNDVCIIFSNLIDNAIEASEKLKDKNKYIVLKSSYINDNFFIMKVENSKSNNIETKNGNIITDKEDKLVHGIGLENVRRTIYKYEGEIDINYDNDVFVVKILIPLPSV